MLVFRQLHFAADGLLQPVDVADEVADELGLGVIVNFIGCADLFNVALVEHGDAVGQGQGFLLIVGDVDGGNAEIPLHLFQLVAQLHPQLGVQIGQGFIHADDGGARHQRAGDGHALLLAAGELADGFFQLLVGKVYLPGDVPHLLVDLGLAQFLNFQAEGDVVVHRHGGEQGVALEHDADIPLFDRHPGNVLVVDAHRAADRLDEARNGAQCGGLAAAGRAQEGEKFAFLHVHVDVVQRFKITEFDDNVLQFDHGENHSLMQFVKNAGKTFRGLGMWERLSLRFLRRWSLGEPADGRFPHWNGMMIPLLIQRPSGSECPTAGCPSRVRREPEKRRPSRSRGWS